MQQMKLERRLTPGLKAKQMVEYGSVIEHETLLECLLWEKTWVWHCMWGRAVPDLGRWRLEKNFSELEGQHWARGMGKDLTDGGMVSANGRELRGTREAPKKANFLETHSGEWFAWGCGSWYLWGSWNWTPVSVGFTSFPLYQILPFWVWVRKWKCHRVYPFSLSSEKLSVSSHQDLPFTTCSWGRPGFISTWALSSGDNNFQPHPQWRAWQSLHFFLPLYPLTWGKCSRNTRWDY